MGFLTWHVLLVRRVQASANGRSGFCNGVERHPVQHGIERWDGLLRASDLLCGPFFARSWLRVRPRVSERRDCVVRYPSATAFVLEPSHYIFLETFRHIRHIDANCVEHRSTTIRLGVISG
jgi:hypothetical protein